MKLIHSLIEAIHTTPEQQKAAARRFRLAAAHARQQPTTPASTAPNESPASPTSPEETTPERLIQLIKTLSQQGFIEPEMLKDFKEIHNLLGRVLAAADTGKLDVKPAEPVAKPQPGSWYAKNKADQEQPQREFEQMRNTMIKFISSSADARTAINNVLLKEFMRRKDM